MGGWIPRLLGEKIHRWRSRGEGVEKGGRARITRRVERCIQQEGSPFSRRPSCFVWLVRIVDRDFCSVFVLFLSFLTPIWNVWCWLLLYKQNHKRLRCCKTDSFCQLSFRIMSVKIPSERYEDDWFNELIDWRLRQENAIDQQKRKRTIGDVKVRYRYMKTRTRQKLEHKIKTCETSQVGENQQHRKSTQSQSNKGGEKPTLPPYPNLRPSSIQNLLHPRSSPPNLSAPSLSIPLSCSYETLQCFHQSSAESLSSIPCRIPLQTSIRTT